MSTSLYLRIFSRNNEMNLPVGQITGCTSCEAYRYSILFIFSQKKIVTYFK